MKIKYGWGTNSYYYLAGKHGIHPSYIQEMLSDKRYGVEDILAVIEHLREEDGKKFNVDTLEGALKFYSGETRGTWAPAKNHERPRSDYFRCRPRCGYASCSNSKLY